MGKAVVGWWVVCGMLAAVSAGAEQREDARPLVVVFESRGKTLPESEIVDALGKELGRPVQAEPAPESDQLLVSVGDDGQLKLRYHSASPELERSLPMPDDPHQLAILVSLAAVNMIRDQSSGLVPPRAANDQAAPPDQSPASPPAKPQPSSPRPTPAYHPKPVATPSVERAPYAKNRFGLHWAPDLILVGRELRLCEPTGDDGRNYACYVGGQRYVELEPTPDTTAALSGYSPTVDGGAITGTKRVLVSYERVLTPDWRVGGRVGLAYDGTPDHFMPLHLEVRGTRVLVPADRRALFRPYLFGSAGMAQATGHLRLPVVIPTENGAYLTATADAYRRTGSWFVGAGAGVEIEPWHGVALDVGLPVMAAFPHTAIVLEPTVGLASAF